jgi:hypothetical protein
MIDRPAVAEITLSMKDNHMNAKLFASDPRSFTLELVENQLVSVDHLLLCCLKYMSTDDVRDMLDSNELSPRFDDEDRIVNQYHVNTNNQEPSGKWTIYADDQGTIVGRYDNPEDVRGHFHDLGLDVDNDTVTIDGDGNGSIVEIPIAWIGDGEKLVGSKRVMDLL